jgi:CBS domain-containing protein
MGKHTKNRYEVRQMNESENTQNNKNSSPQTENGVKEQNNDVETKVNTSTDTNENTKNPVTTAIQKMVTDPAAPAGESISSTKTKNQEPDTKSSPLEIYAKDIMQKSVLWSNPDDNVQDTLMKINQHDTGYVMIGQEPTLEGIVSEADLKAALSPYLRPEFAKWRKPLDEATFKIRIKWIMNSPVNTIKPETPITEIMENMCRFGQRALPVVDQQGKVQGLVTVFDVFKGLIKQFHHI